MMAQNSKKIIPGLLGEDQVARLAKKNLSEDPSRRDKDVKAIQEWITKQPHLNGNIRIGTIVVTTSVIEFLNQFFPGNHRSLPTFRRDVDCALFTGMQV
jgi:hypothetical protein